MMMTIIIITILPVWWCRVGTKQTGGLEALRGIKKDQDRAAGARK